jgi:adenine-specific DNA-methyltransferase
VWEGKYDEYGNRREVDIAGCAMPLQRIETIDEPRSRAEAEKDQATLFELRKQAEKLGDFRNLLIWGDNKLVMASLFKDFKGKIDLIYIDPPFDMWVPTLPWTYLSAMGKRPLTKTSPPLNPIVADRKASFCP